MYNKADNIFTELKDILVKEYPDFKGIYFYGSRVKGNYNSESDYDLVALFDSIERKKKLEIFKIIGLLEYTNEIFIDLKILTPAQFNYNPFFHSEVINHGIYYGRE